MGPDGVHPRCCGSWGRWGLVPCLLWPWAMEERICPRLGVVAFYVTGGAVSGGPRMAQKDHCHPGRKTSPGAEGCPWQGGFQRLGEVAAGDRASVATVVSQFLHPGAARGDLSRTTRPLSAQRYLVQTSLSDSVAQTIARKMCSGQCAWVFHPLGSGLAIRERASSHRCGQQHQQSKLFASTPRSDAKRPTKVGLVFFFPPCYLQISLF